MNRQKGSPLRVITYLVPGISVEYFEFIAHYLEDVLNLNSVLCYESRFCGPRKGQLDVFESNLADVAFISGSAYQQLLQDDNKFWELLPVGAVHSHRKGEVAGYYADVIININMV